MKIAAINGGPRLKWNTDMMLNSFIEGIREADPEAEIIRVNLYHYKYSGCRECYLCKMDNDRFYGHCQFKDEILPVLQQLEDIDGIVCATPVFYDDISGQLKIFLERFLFPKDSWQKGVSTGFEHHIFSAMLYTMNNSEERAFEKNYPVHFGKMERYFERLFQETPDRVCAYNTYGLDDYSRYRADRWDASEKFRRHTEVFPDDLENAKLLGAAMVGKIKDYQEKQ